MIKYYQFLTEKKGIIKIYASCEANAVWKFLDRGRPSVKEVYGEWRIL